MKISEFIRVFQGDAPISDKQIINYNKEFWIMQYKIFQRYSTIVYEPPAGCGFEYSVWAKEVDNLLSQLEHIILNFEDATDSEKKKAMDSILLCLSFMY